MGKKRSAVIGSPEEDQLKAEKSLKREQKKLREGKPAKVPGLKGGQKVVDTTAQTVEEYEKVQEKLASSDTVSSPTPAATSPKTAKKVHVRSKSYKSSKSQIDIDKYYSIQDSLNLLRKVSLTRFDPTVELHLILKSSPSGKVTLTLPHSFGKAKRIAIASDEVIAQIQAGKIDFDVLVASPSQMGKLVKFAKVLGPKGLMPNPKSGTVSDNPEATAKKLSTDQSTTLRLDPSGPVIHTTVGKLSFKDKQLEENISALINSVTGNLKKAVLKSTMSPAIKIQV